MDTFLPSCPNADWGLLEQRQPIRLHGHCTHGGHLTEKAGGGLGLSSSVRRSDASAFPSSIWEGQKLAFWFLWSEQQENRGLQEL